MMSGFECPYCREYVHCSESHFCKEQKEKMNSIFKNLPVLNFNIETGVYEVLKKRKDD